MAELLIVDNDQHARNEISSIISESKYNFLSIYEASTVQRGLLLLKQSQPSALIIDLSLPDMDGIKFGRTALQLYPSLPIIVVTQLKMFELAQQAMNSGFSSYLLKPLSKNELLETFDRVLTPEISSAVNQVINKGSGSFITDLKNPIESAIQFIQLNYGESLTLKQISNQVYLSPSYFSRLFKEDTGMTFVEYVSFVRVQKAKGMLRLSSLPIEVIANNTGFANSSYFATAFKKIVEKTPSEYRDQFHWESNITVTS
ncbi:AraC family transcriptional regulator [Peribacillus cavernae]|uniref:AraC family transcriptional regulator n=1 Tax=Peribacillus cavernae TaxID=1674310 RepID=A0A433HRK8_9BACI|nr:AraC family transcriptional regulator [Peribacillus cavernae]MDQ0218701.1 YesN/AraC family two-component response regulator [Peribacillus cavernae]RUQ30918.1 AraC family transcriptional regulator [Peribacillus cavernae]